LVQHAMHTGDMQGKAADKALRSYGIRVRDNELLIANSAPNMRKLLRETPYTPWQRTLGDFPGSHNNDNKPVHFMAGLTSKVMSLPLDAVVGGDPVQGEELDFDGGDLA
jgi:hypothetical protein